VVSGGDKTGDKRQEIFEKLMSFDWFENLLRSPEIKNQGVHA